MGQKSLTIGILTVNGLSFHPNGRLSRAAGERGASVTLINPYRVFCSLKDGSPGMGSGLFERVPDVILPRQGSPMGGYGFVLLRQFTGMGIPLVNGIDGITIARNQYITLQTLAGAGLPVPDSCFVTKPDTFFPAVRDLGGYPVVVKQVSGMGGDGVCLIRDDAQAEQYLDRYLEPVKGLVVQAYIPPGERRDIRMLVVGDRVAGAMALTPARNEFRANVHQNGRAETIDPPKEWKRLALAAAKACRLDIAGVDMMVEKSGRTWVVEVNYSPGFRGLEGATGKDIAGAIIDFTRQRAMNRFPVTNPLKHNELKNENN